MHTHVHTIEMHNTNLAQLITLVIRGSANQGLGHGCASHRAVYTDIRANVKLVMLKTVWLKPERRALWRWMAPQQHGAFGSVWACCFSLRVRLPLAAGICTNGLD